VEEERCLARGVMMVEEGDMEGEDKGLIAEFGSETWALL
jgi:hypothetical protein